MWPCLSPATWPSQTLWLKRVVASTVSQKIQGLFPRLGLAKAHVSTTPDEQPLNRSQMVKFIEWMHMVASLELLYQNSCQICQAHGEYAGGWVNIPTTTVGSLDPTVNYYWSRYCWLFWLKCLAIPLDWSWLIVGMFMIVIAVVDPVVILLWLVIAARNHQAGKTVHEPSVLSTILILNSGFGRRFAPFPVSSHPDVAGCWLPSGGWFTILLLVISANCILLHSISHHTIHTLYQYWTSFCSKIMCHDHQSIMLSHHWPGVASAYYQINLPKPKNGWSIIDKHDSPSLIIQLGNRLPSCIDIIPLLQWLSDVWKLWGLALARQAAFLESVVGNRRPDSSGS